MAQLDQCQVIIIIIIIISLLKQLTNCSHKTQYNEIRKKIYTKEKQSSYGAHM